ncbi:MAG: DUF2027 domain-containing protein [Bacteroidaceae bacterium]|nr:DUF2027 domain-containing protein [Bacteroidaceae bacterium]
MKIGDKVRFLSEVGGGIVSGFQGKDIVLVEDEDGFEIPMLKKDVVIIDCDDYDIGKVNTRPNTKPANKEPEKEPEPCEKPITFKAKPIERKGGEKLNLYLSFVPVNIKEISNTTFETYLVNDSNYYIQVLYLSAEGNNWHPHFNAVIEPNCKEFVEEFDRSQLNSMERLCIQTIAWKQDKPFALKPALSTEIRLDGTKFYKLHTFHPNEFFTDPNLTIPVIQDDQPKRSVFADAELLKEALTGTRASQKQELAPHNMNGQKKQERPKIIEIDLHSSELLETTSGLSNSDILKVQMDEFRKVMDENIKHKGQKIVFIHGKGDGILRKNLLQELKYRYKGCTAQDASFREYGFGATLIKIG